jgi:hypothetical protein
MTKPYKTQILPSWLPNGRRWKQRGGRDRKVEIAIQRMIISMEGGMEMTIMGGIVIKNEGITTNTGRP